MGKSAAAPIDVTARYECAFDALEETIQLTCGLTLEPMGDATAQGKSGDLLAAFTFQGDVNWTLAVRMSEMAAATIATRFTGYEVSFDSPTLTHAVTELTSLWAGMARAKLETGGVRTSRSRPVVQVGEAVPPLFVGAVGGARGCFTCPAGIVCLEIAESTDLLAVADADT